MKRTLCLILGMAVIATVAMAQSLGDVARKQRQEKKPPAARVYTNDDLPTNAPINVGSSPAAEKSDSKVAEKTATPGSPEEIAKLSASWRAKLDEQKKAIAMLERELDVTQREYRQRVAEFYWDAGTRLRDDRKWADNERKYQADLADKQKQVADARQKLDDMREEARKAGVPSSATE